MRNILALSPNLGNTSGLLKNYQLVVHSKTTNVTKDKERLSSDFRLMETKKILQLNEYNPSVNTVLKGKEMLKDIIGSTKKIGM